MAAPPQAAAGSDTALVSTSVSVPIVMDTVDHETRLIQAFVYAEIASGRTDYMIHELVRARTVATGTRITPVQASPSPAATAAARQQCKDLENEKVALQAESVQLKSKLEAAQARMTQLMGPSLGSLSPPDFMSLKLQNEAARLAIQAEELKRSLCRMCHTRKSTVLFYPCRHTCVCDVCGTTRIVLKQTACMVCAQPVMDTIVGASSMSTLSTPIPSANPSALIATAAATPPPTKKH